MTLDWSKTAHDCAIVDVLARILDDEIWYDGMNWWSRTSPDSPNPHRPWFTGRGADHVYKLMRAGRQLPSHPTYWQRLERLLSTPQSAYKVLALLRDACLVGIIRRPRDLNVINFCNPQEGDCLCNENRCQRPPIPTDAQM